MRTELYDYDIYPKVIRKGKKTTISIKPMGLHVAFDPETDYRITVNGLEFSTRGNFPCEGNDPDNITVKPVLDENGILKFTFTFPAEQMYFIRLFDDRQENPKKLLNLRVYAVDDDLCGRYPFAGDLHMHTCRSDGRQSPAIVSANYRKHGYDFFAITDHGRYYPSLEAIEAFKDVPVEFVIVPGEEVHMPRFGEKVNDVHIVNFGGKFSINGLTEEGNQIKEKGKDKSLRSYQGADCPDVLTVEDFSNQVTELSKTLDIPADVDAYPYACCVWVFNKIREAEGLGIFAHPYWISNMYQIPERFTDYLLEQHPFDAFEVLGGESYYEQNGHQTLKYYEMRSRGVDFPIVGSTDSHSSVNNDNAYVASTIVFSPVCDRENLIASIKEKYSVAVDGISKEFRIVGDFRLGKYASFLLQDFFPLHDDLCYEEGRLMREYACGDEEAAKALEFISGRMKKQREKYFSF